VVRFKIQYDLFISEEGICTYPNHPQRKIQAAHRLNDIRLYIQLSMPSEYWAILILVCLGCVVSNSNQLNTLLTNTLHQSDSSSNSMHLLPDSIIVGYASWNQCDDKIIQAVKDGVNVVIWFATNLSTDPVTGVPIVIGGPDMDCVADKIQKIRELNLPTIHLISIGGWNSPHPDTSNSAEAVYEAWDRWNREIAARPEKGFLGFSGFDWDIEGNDDPLSAYNHFSVECLDLMGRVSQLAKQRGGYIVSMAPAGNYIFCLYNIII
jgi:hypothetical protein